jgi:hypothetical protein
MSVILKSGASSDLATVDTNKNLKVITPQDPETSGIINISGEVHDGSVGLAKLARQMDITPDFRQRVGIDSVLHQDNFNHATFNTSVYQGNTSTMTIVVASNVLSLNDGASVLSGAVARVNTYRSFPLYGTFPVYVECWAKWSLAPQNNNITEFGLGYATTTTTPTDGVYFKMNSSGILQGVVNYGGVETVATGTMPIVAANQVYHLLIVIQNDRAEFWVDGFLYASADRAASATGLVQALTLPLLIRHQNSNTTTGAQKFQVSSISISNGDINTNKPVAHIQAMQGLGGYLVPHGTTAGFTQNYVNSTVPASATLSNTAAGYTTLGGQFQFAAVAGAETDYALFGYQVPTGSATIPARNFVITGVRIFTYNTVVAVATTPTIMQWCLGVGSTAVSLATADSATTGTRAPRRFALGVQSFIVGAAVGQLAEPIDEEYAAPLLAEPGTFIHLILRMPVGTATATEVFRGIASISGYWE